MATMLESFYQKRLEMITKSKLHAIASTKDKADRKKAAAKAERDAAKLKKRIDKLIAETEKRMLAEAKKGKFYLEVTIDDETEGAIISYFGPGGKKMEVSHHGDGISHRVVGLSWKNLDQ